MRSILLLIVFSISQNLNAQTWKAEVKVEVRQGNQAIGGLSSGYIKFSGQERTILDPSANPFSAGFSGSGSPTGLFEISAFGPNNDGVGQIGGGASVEYSYCTPSVTSVNVAGGTLKITVTYYPGPLLELIPTVSKCGGNTTIEIDQCDDASPVQWLVSTTANNFILIQGQTGSQLVVNRDFLLSTGFVQPYGTFYFKAIANPDVHSNIVSFYIHPPGPDVIPSKKDLVCHNGINAQGGSIALSISPKDVAINKFIVRLYSSVDGPAPLNNKVRNTGANYTFDSLGAGQYWVEVQNNSDSDIYGQCFTTRQTIGVQTLNNPAAITIQLSAVNFNGKQISCKGFNNGSITAGVNNAIEPMQFTWSGSGVANGATISQCGPGNHSVSVTDNNKCTATSPVLSLEEPPQLTLSLSPVDATCKGLPNGSINSTPGGGVGGYTYLWSNSEQTQNITGLGQGNYTLTLRDANQCTIASETHINEPQAITFDIHEDHGIDCPDSLTGALTVNNIQHQQGQVYFDWHPIPEHDDFNDEQSIIGVTAGNHFVTVKDDAGCRATRSRQLINAPTFTVQIIPTSNYNGSRISCYEESDGELQAQLYDNFGVAANANSYQWKRNGANHSNGQNISDLNVATYMAIATYGQGCIATSPNYELQQPSPVAVQISPSSNHHGLFISCPGKDDGALTANASGGTPGNYTYQWDNGPLTKDFAGLIAGTYFVTAHDINNCSGSISYQLNDPAPVVPSINVVSDYFGQAITCTGATDGELSASATGGAVPYSFKWNTGHNGVNLMNLPAGSYSVEATDANGCKVQTQPVEIIDPEKVNASISILSNYNGQAIQCFNDANGSIRANGSGGTNVYSYLWSTNAITRDLSGLSHGNYSVVISDQNGCSDFVEVDLENPEPVIVILDSLSSYNGFGVQCNGSDNGLIEVSGAGGTNNFTVDWPLLFQTTNRVEDLGAGNYSVTITDSNGCSENEVFEITEPPILTLGELNHININCYGGSDGALTVVSNGGFGVHEYSVNNSGWQLPPNFSELVAETPYIVTVKDGNQCTETFETQLSQPDEIEISFSVEPAFCADPVGMASAEVSGGVGSYNFEWKNQLGNVISIYPSITKQFAGIYTFTVHDTHGCLIEKPIGIPSVDGPEVLVVENKQTSCFDSSDGYARVDVTNGKGPFIIDWDSGGNTLEVNNLSRGAHYVSVTDPNNCVGVIPVVTISPDVVSASLVQKINVSCHLSCDGEIQIEGQGGNGDYTFTWNNINGSSTASGLCMGVYTVDVTDRLGCQGSQTFIITQPDPVELKVMNRKLPDCNGGCNGSIEVMASGGTGTHSYLWTAGSQVKIQNSICAGSYTVITKDENNCAVSRVFDLGEPTKVEIALIENKPPTCYNGCDAKIEIAGHGGVGGYRFVWADGSVLSKNTSLCVGEHEVTIIDGNSCSANEKYSIANVPELKIDLGGGLVVCEGQEHELDAGPSWKKVEWRNSGTWISSSPKIKISQAGTYEVQVFDANNCKATDSFVLETSDDLLQASFIIAAEALVNDTIVMIDISWPLPDDISWTFPKEMTKLVDNGDVIHGKFQETGEFDIVLHATLGQCNDEVVKTIVILENDKENKGGRLGVEGFVKAFTLYPNPNTGTFEVEIELGDESPVTMTVWNLGTTRLVSKVSDEGSNQYKKHFDLQPIPSGTYLLRVDFDGGHRTVRFLVH